MAHGSNRPESLWRQRRLQTPTPELNLCDVAVVALDVETTGRSAELGHRVTEIAIVGRDIAPLECVIGSSNEDGASSFADIADEVIARLEKRVVVGHNVTFDLEFLAHEFERFQDSTLPAVSYVDTLAFARGTMMDRGRWTLSAVAGRLGLAPEGELHTAVVDATLALDIFEVLAARIDSPTLADIGLRRLIWKGRSS